MGAQPPVNWFPEIPKGALTVEVRNPSDRNHRSGRTSCTESGTEQAPTIQNSEGHLETQLPNQGDASRESLDTPGSCTSHKQTNVSSDLSLTRPNGRIDELTLELVNQWHENHFEHCGHQWPHSGLCHWPLPEVLRETPNVEALLAQLLG